MNPDAVDLSGERAFQAHGMLSDSQCVAAALLCNAAEASMQPKQRYIPLISDACQISIKACLGKGCNGGCDVCAAGVRPGFIGWSSIQEVQ